MTEAQAQEAVVEWCEWHHVPVFAIPNGGKRNAAEAAHLKRQGVRAGVPDLCIPVARGRYHGLYIEMKVGRNKPTALQAEWIRRLRENGYAAAVCWGADSAIETLRRYLDLYDFRKNGSRTAIFPDF